MAVIPLIKTFNKTKKQKTSIKLFVQGMRQTVQTTMNGWVFFSQKLLQTKKMHK